MKIDLSKIKLVITDVDGVLTDGSLYYNAQGEVLKNFNVYDGLGIKMLMTCGIHVAVLSGGDTPVLRKRIQDLGITHYALGKVEKRTACLALMEQVGVSKEETLFIGDDSLDLPAFEVCGVKVAVPNGMPYVKAQADIVLTTSGGRGAVRELSDMILKAQGKAEVFETADGFVNVAHKLHQ